MSDVAVVSGAAGGIGRAITEQLLSAHKGLRCAAIDLAADELGSLVEIYGSDRVMLIQADARKNDSVRHAIDRVAKELGPPTKLVTAAGIQFNCASEDLPYAEWRRVLEVNLDGVFSFCQAVGRYMLAAGRGAIVNVGSISAYFGFARRLPYIVSKAGLGGLTQTLAVEWAGRGVRVNSVAPGFVDTPLVREAISQGHVDEEEARSHHALGRFATPSEIAEVVDFLLSDKASFITGETICVDGGFRVKKF